MLNDGTRIILNKPKAKGELFLIIKKANGDPFPLKLNIKHISETHADILSDIMMMRFNDKSINRQTVIADMDNQEFKDN